LNIVKKIKSLAKQVILNESFALKNSSTHINDDFEQFVRVIINSKGRLVVTGIGKSALVGKKLSATFNSTGTLALFMHAAEALHGDIGMVCKDDVVLVISKSGNTPEIKALIPLIKRLGVKIGSLVSNTESYLAKQSDYVLDTSIEFEASPDNLVPTASATVHLAWGHALAVCLFTFRGFTMDDYARLHPGGAIGAQLYLTVDDLMVLNERPVVKENAAVKEVIIEISAKRLGAVAVLDQNDHICGIITDGDLRRMLESSENWEAFRAKDIMTKDPVVLSKGSYASDALSAMQENNITQVIIKDNNNLCGFVHIHDILKKGII